MAVPLHTPWGGGQPTTPLSGSATFGGPGIEPAAEQQQLRQGAAGLVSPAEIAAGRVPQPQPGAVVRTGLEIGGALAGAGVGGLAAKAVGVAASGLIGRGVTLLSRALGAGIGDVAGSELAAPAGESAAEAMERRQTAALSGAAGEALAKPGSAVAGAVLRPLKRTLGGLSKADLLEPSSAEVQALLRSHGATLTPGQFKKGFLFDTIENIAESSFAGGGLIQRTRGRASAAAVSALHDATPKVSQVLSPQQAGQVLSEAISNSATAQRAYTSAAYKALDAKILQAGGGAVVDLRPLQRATLDKLGTALKMADPIAVKIHNLVHVLGDSATFGEADKLRGALLNLARSDEALVPGLKALAGGLVDHELDLSVQAAGLRLGPLGQEVLNAFALARSTARFGKQTFNDDLIGNLAGKVSPEELAQSLFQAERPTRVAEVREILFNPKYRQAIGNPEEVWAHVQASYLGTLRMKAGERGAAGELSGKALGRELDKAGGTFRELFTNPLERNALRLSARALEMTQAKASGSRSGSILIQLMQGQAAAGAVLGVIGVIPHSPGLQSTEGVILLGPAALALALSRPRFASFLLKEALGREARTGRTAGPVMAQIISHLREAGVPFSYRANDGTETQVNPPHKQSGLPTAPAAKSAQSLKPQSKFNAWGQGQPQ